MLGTVLRRIDGPPRLVASIEATLGSHAVVAAGVPGNGPWRLITARYDRIKPAIATLQLGALGQRLVPGAVLMTDADAFAKKTLALAEELAREGARLEAPWFLRPQEDLLVLLKRGALAGDVKAWAYDDYVARVEALVRRELER